MPRRAQAPGVRSDGEATPGNLSLVGAGQSNGRPVRSALTQAAAVGTGERQPYGQAGQLQQDVANTQAPPGVAPEAHAAMQGLQNYQHAATPLFAPTARPWEPVTAGAPLDPGPTNPMAMPMAGAAGASVADILQQAAQASGSQALQALAQRAQAVASS